MAAAEAEYGDNGEGGYAEGEYQEGGFAEGEYEGEYQEGGYAEDDYQGDYQEGYEEGYDQAEYDGQEGYAEEQYGEGGLEASAMTNSELGKSGQPSPPTHFSQTLNSLILSPHCSILFCMHECSRVNMQPRSRTVWQRYGNPQQSPLFAHLISSLIRLCVLRPSHHYFLSRPALCRL